MLKLTSNLILKTLFCFFFLNCTNCLAFEQIRDFSSIIEVKTDGSLLVTENITVHHEGNKIRRGIYRNLPTIKGESYKVISVLRNGKSEPYFIEHPAGYYQINTGNDDFLPSPATSTFQITYLVKYAIKSYSGYDEVYWNVTGNEWEFPILQTSAKVKLPDGAQVIQQASYVGYDNSTISGFSDAAASFSSRSLKPGEQLTIAVGFTPGIVQIPFASQKLIMAVCGILFGLIYFIIFWFKYGRDPKAQTIMPRFEPPAGLSATQCTYLTNNGIMPNNLLLVHFISLVHSGYLSITHKIEEKFIGKKDIYILKPERSPQTTEEKYFNRYCYKKELVLDGKRQPLLQIYTESLAKTTKASLENSYYNRRLFYSISGSILMLVWGSLLVEFNPDFWHLAFLCMIFSSLALLSKLYAFIAFIFLNIIASNVLGFLSIGMIYLDATLILSNLFSYLLFQPTIKGQRTIEELKGLEMFLKATYHPSNPLNTGLDIAKMENLFPYAVALGLEKEWEKNFKAHFGAAAIQSIRGHNYYSPSFSKNLSSTITSSGGGSGSSGGGSAGGGCGGGGGGGR